MKLKLLIMLLILTFLLNGCNKEENIYPVEFSNKQCKNRKSGTR